MDMSGFFKVLSVGVIALFLSACKFSLDGRGLTNNLYCDNFLIYDMCASDPNRDGVVDFVYFEDTSAVFMYAENGLSQKPDQQPMHRCAEQMEPELVKITSRLFYVDETTAVLEKSDIRGAMTLRYLAKLPEITACNLRAQQAEERESELRSESSVGQS